LSEVYTLARTYFKQTYGNSNIKANPANRSDRSRDIAPARPAPAVLGSALTNADQPEQGAKLNHNQGVIYLAKPSHPGYFGSPDRHWRPVNYAGSLRGYRPDYGSPPSQLTGNPANDQLPTKEVGITTVNQPANRQQPDTLNQSAV